MTRVYRDLSIFLLSSKFVLLYFYFCLCSTVRGHVKIRSSLLMEIIFSHFSCFFKKIHSHCYPFPFIYILSRSHHRLILKFQTLSKSIVLNLYSQPHFIERLHTNSYHMHYSINSCLLLQTLTQNISYSILGHWL